MLPACRLTILTISAFDISALLLEDKDVSPSNRSAESSLHIPANGLMNSPLKCQRYCGQDFRPSLHSSSNCRLIGRDSSKQLCVSFHVFSSVARAKRCIFKRLLWSRSWLTVWLPLLRRCFHFFLFLFDLLGEPHSPRAAYLVVHVSTSDWFDGADKGFNPVWASRALVCRSRFMRGLLIRPLLCLAPC